MKLAGQIYMQMIPVTLKHQGNSWDSPLDVFFHFGRKIIRHPCLRDK